MNTQAPTVIVNTGPKDCIHDYVPERVAALFGCKGAVTDWSQDQEIRVGHMHFCESYEPARGGPTVAMGSDFRVLGPIEVISLDDALDCVNGRATLEGASTEVMAMSQLAVIGTVLTSAADYIHAQNVNAGWWTDIETGEDLHGKRNVGELLALVHSEVSEALEGYRKGLMDDHLPNRPMFRVELIDTIIRLLDILGSEQNIEHPAGGIFVEKVEYNARRADHQIENRRKDGGKKI